MQSELHQELFCAVVRDLQKDFSDHPLATVAYQILAENSIPEKMTIWLQPESLRLIQKPKTESFAVSPPLDSREPLLKTITPLHEPIVIDDRQQVALQFALHNTVLIPMIYHTHLHRSNTLKDWRIFSLQPTLSAAETIASGLMPEFSLILTEPKPTKSSTVEHAIKQISLNIDMESYLTWENFCRRLKASPAKTLTWHGLQSLIFALHKPYNIGTVQERRELLLRAGVKTDTTQFRLADLPFEPILLIDEVKLPHRLPYIINLLNSRHITDAVRPWQLTMNNTPLLEGQAQLGITDPYWSSRKPPSILKVFNQIREHQFQLVEAGSQQLEAVWLNQTALDNNSKLALKFVSQVSRLYNHSRLIQTGIQPTSILSTLWN